MNHYLINNEQYFTQVFDKINKNKKLYLYGKGFVGNDLKKYLSSQNINISGFIDDYRKEQDVYELNEVEKDSQIIIAIYKESLLHKVYKKLITHGINYKNIIDLI